MIADRRFRATCKGCNERFDLFHYEGLNPESRMGSHSCRRKRDRERLYFHTRGNLVRNLKEAKLK